MCIFVASCGQTYKLQSITVSPAAGYILEALGSSGPLTVTANYSNTKTDNVTTSSTYEVGGSTAPGDAAPLGVVTVDNSGVVHNSSTVLACTLVPTTSNGTTTYAHAPYPVNISYTENGVTVTTSVPIDVTTAPGCGGQ
jgi:hypothetical protein